MAGLSHPEPISTSGGDRVEDPGFGSVNNARQKGGEKGDKGEEGPGKITGSRGMISRDGGWLSVVPSDAVGCCVLHVSCMEGDRVSEGGGERKSVFRNRGEHLIRKQMSLPKHTLLAAPPCVPCIFIVRERIEFSQLFLQCVIRLKSEFERTFPKIVT